MNPSDPQLPRSRFAAHLAQFPEVIFIGAQASKNAGQWSHLFQSRIGPTFTGKTIFEIGCFDAALLCRIAAKHPGTAFIGLDWKARAIFEGAQRIEAMALKNILLIRGRGQEISQIFAPRELDQIWIFHPDPFAEPAELPNRLISERFLLDAHATLRDTSSRVILKTDHPEYYQTTLRLMDARGIADRFKIFAQSPDFWNDKTILDYTANHHFSGEMTGFESRFTTKKLPIAYLELVKR